MPSYTFLSAFFPHRGLAIYISNDIANKIDCLFDSISKILESYPDSEIIVVGDFNIHNSNWLHHSSHTSREGLFVMLFAENNNLKQLVKEPTYFPNVERQCQNILDLFMTSDPEKYEVHNLAPLGISNHVTISAYLIKVCTLKNFCKFLKA